jgi:hypothetical protein
VCHGPARGISRADIPVSADGSVGERARLASGSTLGCLGSLLELGFSLLLQILQNYGWIIRRRDGWIIRRDGGSGGRRTEEKGREQRETHFKGVGPACSARVKRGGWIDGNLTWKLAILQHKYNPRGMPNTVADILQNPGRGLLLSLDGAIEVNGGAGRARMEHEMQQGFLGGRSMSNNR